MYHEWTIVVISVNSTVTVPHHNLRSTQCQHLHTLINWSTHGRCISKTKLLCLLWKN